MSKNLPLSISTAAYDELIRIKTALHLDESQGLRIGIKGGGCSGISRFLAFDKKEEKDEEFKERDLTVFINKSHLMHLVGFKINYENNGNEKGFIFQEAVQNEF